MNGHQHVQVGKVNGLKLPIEDEDYLMPSPQFSAVKTQYMDLIGDTITSGK